MIRLLSPLLLLAAGLPALAAADEPSALQRAMADELERSMSKLVLETLERPYFIAYTVSDFEERTVFAADGALVVDQSSRWRTAQVEVRVGDYDFDNTNFSGRGGWGGGFAILPLEDDYEEIRRQLWLATDAAYKGALSSIAGKRAALQNRIQDDAIPDFSRSEPVQVHTDTAMQSLAKGGAQERVLESAAVLANHPGVLRSNVLILAQEGKIHFLNSEGTSFTRYTPFAGMLATAGTQVEDGTVIDDHVLAYGRTFDDLPSVDAARGDALAMAERLERLRTAPELERYNGPVIFQGQAAGEVLAQGLGPHLVARRAPVNQGNGFQSPAAVEAGFQDRIGARVLPRFLGLIDDPTASEFEGQPFPSGFTIDDQGVLAAPTVLVERGRLRSLLSNRTPTRDMPASTGNARNGMVAPSNVILTASEQLDGDAFDEELMALVEESGNAFGVVVTRLQNPLLQSELRAGLSGPGTAPPSPGSLSAIEAFKVYPDGSRQLIRNLQIMGVSPDVFKDIIAVGEQRQVYTAPIRLPSFNGQMSRGGGAVNQFRQPTASWATLPLLFEDLTLRKATGDNPSLPVVPAPAFVAD